MRTYARISKLLNYAGRRQHAGGRRKRQEHERTTQLGGHGGYRGATRQVAAPHQGAAGPQQCEYEDRPHTYDTLVGGEQKPLLFGLYEGTSGRIDRMVPTLQSCPRVIGRLHSAVGKILDATGSRCPPGLPVDDVSMSRHRRLSSYYQRRLDGLRHQEAFDETA